MAVVLQDRLGLRLRHEKRPARGLEHATDRVVILDHAVVGRSEITRFARTRTISC